MEKITQTVEQVVGYKANDGTWFRSEEECLKYEQSARCAAQLAAKALQIKDMDLESTAPFCGCYEERMITYDIKTAADLQVLNTWLEFEDKHGDKIDPKYIGKRIVIQYWIDSGHYVLGTREEVEATFREKMDKLFADPEVTE